MTASTGKGTAMHMEFIRVRFASKNRHGPDSKLAREHIPEVRKLLRTAMSITDIANHFSIARPTMVSFIKRYQLCDMKARHDFISLQESLAREERREASK